MTRPIERLTSLNQDTSPASEVRDDEWLWFAARLPGVVKAISEEMEPGSREYCLARLDELIDAVISARAALEALKKRYDLLEGRYEEVAQAVERLANTWNLVRAALATTTTEPDAEEVPFHERRPPGPARHGRFTE